MKKIYNTKKRKAKIMVRKAIVLISAIMIANGLIGFYGQQFEIFAIAEINVPKKQEVKPLTVKEQIIKVAEAENFKYTDYLIRLAACESRLNQYAIGDSGKSRGLFQIHKGYHPDISDECSFSVECSTRWTMKMINAGYQNRWSCDKIIKNNKDYLKTI